MRQARLSWGRYPYQPQQLHHIYWPEDVARVLAKRAKREPIASDPLTGAEVSADANCPEGAVALSESVGVTDALAFGMGRSYGDSCLAASGHLIAMSAMDRVLAVDWEKGILLAQAGLTLDGLIRVALPRGWFVPVTPGTRFVTLGGAVANDVHGKNHHSKGTFGAHVRSLVMYRSEEGIVECSPHLRAELFAGTVAGLGLTGIILAVELQLSRIASSYVDERSIRFGSLDEFFDLSQQHDRQYEYSVAWLDCLATGKHAGRGHYILGNHAANGPLELAKERNLTLRYDPPLSLINGTTIRLFNSLYYHRQRAKERQRRVAYTSFFYPLDRILHWNRLYGRGGFQQFQCVVPEEDAREVIGEILAVVARRQAGSFLAVLKRCGEMASPGLLSFPMPGVTLALDFPQREPDNRRLFESLDSLVHEAGGRLYPAKDAHMNAADFQRAYPAWHVVEGLRDPRLLSSFWKRVAR